MNLKEESKKVKGTVHKLIEDRINDLTPSDLGYLKDLLKDHGTVELKK